MARQRRHIGASPLSPYFLTSTPFILLLPHTMRLFQPQRPYQVLITVCVSLFLAQFTATAQTVRWEIGGGLAQQIGKSEAVGSYKLGVAYEYELDQRWALSLGLAFQGKGWKTPDTLVPIVDLNDQPVYETDGTTQRQGLKSIATEANYLTLPLVAHHYWRLKEGRYLLFGIGGYVGYGLFGKRKIKGDTSLPGTQKYFYSTHTFSSSSMRRWDAGAVIKCGYQPSEKLIVGMEADLGLLKTAAKGSRNASLLLTIAYRMTKD